MENPSIPPERYAYYRDELRQARRTIDHLETHRQWLEETLAAFVIEARAREFAAYQERCDALFLEAHGLGA